MEEWKVAIEDYEISNLGNCRRKLKNGSYKTINGSLISTPASKNKTYKMRYFQLNREGKRINYLFSHLVAYCFLGERPEGFDIDHIDRDPLNNNVNNLRYISHRDNCLNQHKTIQGITTDINERKKIVQQLWIIENKEYILDKKREYYEKNKDKILNQMKEHYKVKKSSPKQEV